MCYSLVFPERQAIRYLSNLIKHMYNENCLEYFICASNEFLTALADKLGILFKTFQPYIVWLLFWF